MIQYLLGKSSTGKFRFAVVFFDEEWDDIEKGFLIIREYGQVRGKTTTAPKIWIKRGLAGRTHREQATLKFNSLVKEYLDKGYISVDKHPNEYSDEELNSLFGEVKTNQAGVIKPQLAKQSDKVTNRKIFDKEWLISRKLDGTKALFYYRDDEIHTASRGGETYDYSTEHLRTYSPLIKFFEEHPSITLDGELFKRGKDLASISGAVRMEKNAYDCDWLEYWIYDCYDADNPDMIAEDRYDFLVTELSNKQEIPMYMIPADDEVETPVRLLYHEYVSGWDNMKKFHDQWVAEGFEGAILTDPSKAYKIGARCNNLLKIKEFQDFEFKITGISEGLREEDLCFTLETEDGKPFKAKPMGSRELKQYYRENIDNIVGKMATVKFFYYSADGIPLLPVVKCIRNYE